MLETLKKAFKSKEIRGKILKMLLLLLIFRLGCFIPVPGLDRATFGESLSGTDFLQIMSSITGGALANGTLFALGIGPYINASIIMQLLAVGIPALERLSKQGEDGRKKISQYTRYLTILLAVLQAVGIIVNYANQSSAIKTEFFGSALWGATAANWIAGCYFTVVYTAGAMLVMWLGERITDYQVGNGQSMIIFIGILSTAGQTILNKIVSISATNLEPIWELVAFFLIALIVFFAIVTVDLAERKIPIQYAKQVKGRKMYGGQSSVIPMKISGSGVMPLIFAFAIISFPSMLASLFWPTSAFAEWCNNWLSGRAPTWYGQVVYALILCGLIFAFAFFYQTIQFQPDEIAKNIQQNGGFIQGIRPGKPTAQYLKKISNRITLFGAIYLALVAFVPSVVFSWASVDLVNVFSTTGILIVVSVALDFDKQLQSQIMMKNYRGFLK